MPELPEVETIVRDVAPRLVGRRIRRAHLAKSDVLRRVSRKRLLAALIGNTVVGATPSTPCSASRAAIAW